MNNEPVAWIEPITESVMKDYDYQNNLFANETGDWIPLYTHPVKEQDCYGDGNVYRGVRSKDSEVKTIYFNSAKELTDEEINVVAILQDAEIVPVGHEIWKTGEEFNKYKRIVLATAKALRKANEK